MKRIAGLIICTIFLQVGSFVYAQGNGWMGRGDCPMCGRSWDGMYYGGENISKELPSPKNQKWIKNLKEVLSLEKLSRHQYENDQKMFNVQMPYMMVIPQENNHIEWISQLLKAYGESADVSIPEAEKSSTVMQAYEYAMQLEADLVPEYEWLIQNAEDETARGVLDTILLQTRMHYNMFNHALRRNGMMGQGMMGGGSRGMMGR